TRFSRDWSSDVCSSDLFNEAIMRQNGNSGLTNYNKPGSFTLSDIVTIKDSLGHDITTDYVIEGTYGTAITNTTNETQLVIKLKTPDLTKAKRTFTVEMKGESATVYDYKGANGFDTTKIGTYIYPPYIDSKIRDAILTGINIG